MKFFKLEPYFNKTNIVPEKDNFVLLINCERNTGKSTATWNYLFKWAKNHNYKKYFVYLRTTNEQVINFKRSFNKSYKEYQIVGNSIYKVKYDESGKLIKENLLGTILALSTQLNTKSNIFEHYHYLFWDEYNDIKYINNIWFNLLMLIKTIQRYNNPFGFILIGNKDNANSEIMVKLGVERSENQQIDYIVNLSNKIDNIKIFFIDVGFNTFLNLKEANINNSIANSLAYFDEDTNRYLNESGYYIDFDDDVINWQKRVKPHITNLLCIFIYESKYLLVGHYNNFRTNEEAVFIHKLATKEIDNYQQLQVLIYGVNNGLSSTIKQNIMNDNEKEQFSIFLYNSNQSNKLTYTSFEIKQDIANWIMLNKYYIEEFF